jgi:hypothetical protein
LLRDAGLSLFLGCVPIIHDASTRIPARQTCTGPTVTLVYVRMLRASGKERQQSKCQLMHYMCFTFIPTRLIIKEASKFARAHRLRHQDA